MGAGRLNRVLLLVLLLFVLLLFRFLSHDGSLSTRFMSAIINEPIVNMELLLLDGSGEPVNATVEVNEYVQEEMQPGNMELLLLDGCGEPVNATVEVNEYVQEEMQPKYCSAEHRQAVDFCSQSDHNKVPMGQGTKGIIRNWGEVRPYSVSPILEDRPLPRCRSIDDYLSAIKLGTRSWPDSQAETKPSAFVPFGCYVPTLPPPAAKTCDLLNQYNHVIFHGDSLSRHLRQAIYMSMSGNLIKSVHVSKASQELCMCDGQFSENRICRQHESYFDESIQPREAPGEDVQLCPSASFSLGKRAAAPWLLKRGYGKLESGVDIDWDLVDCADNDYRGILLVLQGGLHFKVNSTETFASFVKPIITHPKYQECLCLGKVRLLWLAMNAQSSELNKHYPHQSRENALIFNEDMKESFASVGLIPGQDVFILDWWNLTADAQSSDGVHYLSDVNLAKAAQILYLVEHWPFPKPFRAAGTGNTTTENSALPMPRQFNNKNGDTITIPQGVPLPPLSVYRDHGVHFKCDS
ncbi:hypothetical protein ACHAXR_009119 [Thalassiosira sp. AJA248-18]